jgi:hypothetical protein
MGALSIYIGWYIDRPKLTSSFSFSNFLPGTEQQIQACEVGGNDQINSIFEATCVFDSIKPNPHSDAAQRVAFVREKYQNLNFYDSGVYRKVMQEEEEASQRREADMISVEDYFNTGHQNRYVTPKLVKPTLAYDDLFSRSANEDNSISEEGDDDDLFADSATTASDLFGHCTKPPRKYRQEAPNLLSMDEEEDEVEESESGVDAEDNFNAFAVNRNTRKRAPSRIELNEDDTFAQFTKDPSSHPPSRKSSPSVVFSHDDDAFAQFVGKDRRTPQPRRRSKHDEMRPVVPTLDIESLEVEKAEAVANEDYLRAAELKKQIDRLTGSSTPRKTSPFPSSLQHKSQKGKNPLDVGSTTTNEIAEKRQSLDNFFSGESEMDDSLLPKGSTSGSSFPTGFLNGKKKSPSNHSKTGSDAVSRKSSSSSKASGKPPRRNSSAQQTVLSAPQEKEVDDFGFVVNTNNHNNHQSMQNNSVRSRSSVKTAPTECTSTTDDFGFAVVSPTNNMSPRSLMSAPTEGLPPRRSSTPTRSGHARSGTSSRRSTTPSKRSSHSRRSTHTTTRKERRPSCDSKGEEGACAPTKPARTSSGSSQHRRSSNRRLSGGNHPPPPEAPAGTPGTPSERSRGKTRSSVLLSPTGIMDDESPLSTPSGRGRRSSRHLCSPASTDATPRRSSRSERTSSRTKKKEQLGPEPVVQRQQRSSSNKWKSPLELF